MLKIIAEIKVSKAIATYLVIFSELSVQKLKYKKKKNKTNN